MTRRRTLAAAATVTVLVVGYGVVQLTPGAAPVARAEGLTPYSGCGQLLSHYRAALRRGATPWGVGGGFGALRGHGDFAIAGGAAGQVAGAAPAAARDGTAAEAGAVGAGETGTNLQEQGVDEPDQVKLVGGRLVAVAQNRLQLMAAGPQPRLLGSLPLGTADQQYVSGELLVAGDRALVISQQWRGEPAPAAQGRAALTMTIAPGEPQTRLVLADISGDRPRLLEEAVLTGGYVSARLTDGTVRLVTTSRPRVPTTQPSYGTQPFSAARQRVAERAALAANRSAAGSATVRQVLPQLVRRNAGGRVLSAGPAVGCSQAAYADGAPGDTTLLVTTLRPADGLGPVDSDAVTTDGDLVYASRDRLYVATSRWGTGPDGAPDPVRPQRSDSPTATAASQDAVTTELHAFDVSGGTTRYLGTGAVPGYVLGRWALSERAGVLRVATTRQPPWDGADREAGRQTSSMLVTLAERDGRLVETGRVEGLGRTERIQAVRYLGDLAIVVTFRQTDPLYLVDLTGAPRVVGELKVPGFSTYLHPLGDGLLLGLGQEADGSGRVTGTQVSVFDINDPTAPRQVDRLQLGQGYSPAQNDSRAFSYDPARRLVTFAFTTYDLDPVMPDAQSRTGALGVRVAADGRLGRVGLLEVAPSAPTERVLYDSAGVYAVSQSGVAAGDAATMRRTGAADFAR